MLDDHPSDVTELNDLEVAPLSTVVLINRIFSGNGYQQKHCLGQANTYWNSVMRVVDSIPRDAQDSSIVLLRDEHGRCLLDDTPLRFDIMLKGMKFFKLHNRHYSHVKPDEHALLQLCTTTAPFIVETDETGPDATEAPGECGSDEELKGSDEMAPELTVHCVESDEEEEIVGYPRQEPRTAAEPNPRNVFTLDSSDEEPLRQIADEAFLGKNYLMPKEPV